MLVSYYTSLESGQTLNAYMQAGRGGAGAATAVAKHGQNFNSTFHILPSSTKHQSAKLDHKNACKH